MATVVNNPGATTDSGSGSSFLIGVILLIVFALVVIFYGLPYLGNMVGGQSGAGTSAAPQVQVPEKVNVDVNQK